MHLKLHDDVTSRHEPCNLLMQVQALIQTRLGREARVCVDRSVSTSPARSEEPEHGYSSHCASPGYMGTDLGQAMSSMMGSQGEQDRHEWGTQHEDYASLASSGDVAVEDGGVGQVPSPGFPHSRTGVRDLWVRTRR